MEKKTTIKNLWELIKNSFKKKAKKGFMITIFKKKWMWILIPLILTLTTISWTPALCDKIVWLEGGDCQNGEPGCIDMCGYYGAEDGQVVCLCMKHLPLGN